MTPRTWTESIAVGIAFAGLVLGVSVIVLAMPAVTRALVPATGGTELSGLSEQATLDLAERVRVYVTRRDAPELPAMIDGREGFTPRAVAHLNDVRGVISAARIATGLLAGVVAIWIGAGISRRRYAALRRGITAGAYATAGAVVLALAGAATGFDRLFAGFHSLFFEGDTWLFEPGEMLVRLFPERFWATAGLLWGVLALLGGVVLYAIAQAIARRTPRAQSS
jgi:integral membrane protein (TIGR01906 family)